MIVKSFILMMTWVIITSFSWAATQIRVSTNYDAYLVVKVSLSGYRLVTEKITSGTNQPFDIKEDPSSENNEIKLTFYDGLLQDNMLTVPLPHEFTTDLFKVNKMYVEILEKAAGEILIKIKLDDVAVINISNIYSEGNRNGFSPCHRGRFS